MSAWVYILTNAHHTTLYIGVTSNLTQRLAQHRSGAVPGYTKRYNIHKLVHVEEHADIPTAIAREKALKGHSRPAKFNLIHQHNPAWTDLASKP